MQSGRASKFNLTLWRILKSETQKIEAILKGIGAQLKKDMPEGMGFALLMFDYGAEGNLFYIGSAQRGDIVKQ